jgi:sterol-4alpha-carboxylate 3-dehydrogenase (decarboxylating)
MTQDIYLVVGGRGFLGNHIVQNLVARGDDVSVFDILNRHGSNVPYYQGDISEEGDLLDALKKVSPPYATAFQLLLNFLSKSSATCIFHTASPHATTATNKEFHKVNVIGTRAVISAAQKAGVKKLVFTSSSGIVFNGKDLNGVNESEPYVKNQMSEYMDTKVIAEKDILAANGQSGLLTCILRPSGIFG